MSSDMSRKRSTSDVDDEHIHDTKRQKIPHVDLIRWYGTDQLKDEPLLAPLPEDERFILNLDDYLDVQEFTKLTQKAIWYVHEVDCSKDRFMWARQSDGIKTMVKNVLGFFLVADGVVNENIRSNFGEELQPLPIRNYYLWQGAVESVHMEMYSTLANLFTDNEADRTEIVTIAKTSPGVVKKVQWSLKWMNGDIPVGMRLIAFAIVEGFFFSASFATIGFIKTMNILPGLTASNEFISRDEGLHRDFAVMLVNKYIVNKPKEPAIHEMMREAVDVESVFIESTFATPLDGKKEILTREHMLQYIRFVADGLLTELGYSKIYNVESPDILVGIMSRFNSDRKGNFFEHRVTDYTRADFGGEDVRDLEDF